MVGRVLIVDDEDTLRLTIKTRLASAGFETESAVDGEEALEKLKGASFDVVLLDINMPRMDGITALGVIADLYPNTDVIMLTGFADFSTAIECLKKGAKDYLVKPIDTTELITRLRSLLRARTSEAALADIRRNHAAFLTDQVLASLVRLSDLVEGLSGEEFGKVSKEQRGALAAMKNDLTAVFESVTSAIDPSHLGTAVPASGAKSVPFDKLLPSAVDAVHPFVKRAGLKVDVPSGSKGAKIAADAGKVQRAFESILAALTMVAGKGASILVEESGPDPLIVTLKLDKSSEAGRKALGQATSRFADVGTSLKGLSGAAILIQIARRGLEAYGGTVSVTTSHSAVSVECRIPGKTRS
jgi:DNA-binding response OmpR family regulator